MGKCFISYRRGDSAGHTGRLIDWLEDRFGPDAFFRDIEGIAMGEDFTIVLDRSLEESDVMLVVIGPGWATATNDDGLRLFQDGDWVRREVADALARSDVKVIPVLVHGATMPDRDDLPPELAPLTRRQKTELDDTRWDADVDRLAERLEELLGIETLEEAAPRPGWLPYVIGAGVAAAIAVVVVVVARPADDDPATTAGVGAPDPSAVVGDDRDTSAVLGAFEVPTWEVAGKVWVTATEPPGDVDWLRAEAWCASLVVEGTTFRLPTVAELESIADPDAFAIFDDGLGSYAVWSGERDGNTAQIYDFFNSTASTEAVNVDDYIHALCVAT